MTFCLWRSFCYFWAQLSIGEKLIAPIFFATKLTSTSQVYFLYVHKTKPSISVKKDQEVNKISNRALTVGMICKLFTIFFLFVSSLGNFQVSKYIYTESVSKGNHHKNENIWNSPKGGRGSCKIRNSPPKGGSRCIQKDFIIKKRDFLPKGGLFQSKMSL